MLKIIYIRRFDESVYQQCESLLYTLLPDSERNEIEKFTNKKRKIEHLLGLVLCRIYLSDLLLVEPKNISLSIAENGKPFCSNHSDVHFNISHGGDFVATAFSDFPVGIDVESWQRKAPMQVAKRYYSPSEWEQLEQVTTEEQQRLFFKLWTVKESYLKMLGTGLTRSLSSFDVRFEQQKPVIYEDEKKLTCDLSQFYPDVKHIITVCSQTSSSAAQCQEITIEDIIKKIEHGNQ